MGIKSAIQVINSMVEAGVVESYAICGAVAALNYIEATLTEDLDVLISMGQRRDEAAQGLMVLTPVFDYLRQAGYMQFKDEGIVIEDWPVQFLPVASALDAEGLAKAIEIDVGEGTLPIRARVLRPEHLVAIALRVGRPKDLIRISQFLEESAVDSAMLCAILDRHGLREAWAGFCRRLALPNPCERERSS